MSLAYAHLEARNAVPTNYAENFPLAAAVLRQRESTICQRSV